MKMGSNLRAVERRQASRKGCHEKRPGALEHTRPLISVTSYSPGSKD
jgi:hypothetical protein